MICQMIDVLKHRLHVHSHKPGMVFSGGFLALDGLFIKLYHSFLKVHIFSLDDTPEKVSPGKSTRLGTGKKLVPEKSTGIGTGKIWSRKKVPVPVPEKILGTVTLCLNGLCFGAQSFIHFSAQTQLCSKKLFMWFQ